MKKLSKREFKNLLTEWNEHLINEFRDTSTRREKSEKPDGFPIENIKKFRLWLVKKIKECQIKELVGFESLKKELSQELIKLSRNPLSYEFDESIVFNTFIEYKEGNNDLYEETGDEFLDHVGFYEDESCKDDNFFYVIISPLQQNLLETSLNYYLLEDDEHNFEEKKKFFVGNHFPGFDLEIAYKSTHSDIEKDIQNEYFKSHNAECFRFKNY